MNDFYNEHNVDVSKLSRDYILNPLKFRECPTKSDLEYLYIDLNIFHSDISSFFNVKDRTLTKWLNKYEIKKPTNLKRQNINKTMLSKYGSEHIFQSDIFKEKSKQTCLKEYGTDFANQNSKVKEKIKKSLFNTYGVEHYKQTLCSKETLKILQSKELLINFINNTEHKNIVYLAYKLNISHSTLRRYINKYKLDDIIETKTNSSIYEEEILELYPFLKKHNRTILNGLEIDLYDETRKIGIEFNGDWWHNEYQKNKFYHQQKSLLAESKGIFLYHIFEYEWISNKERIINQLNNLFGLNQTKIYARCCDIREVDNKEKTKFLEENHLQGNDTSSIKLGLYYNNELVSLMTFVKPRFNKKYEWELSRFCSKSGCNVIGGASRLFKYFIKSYNPENIISYSNIAHTRGNLYKLLGMRLEAIAEPNYVWVGDTILSRYQCQKHKLLEQGFIGNSEVDIMHSRDYFRIYDCGNKVWVWKKL